MAIRDTIDRVINTLCDTPANIRQQHPLYRAIADAVKDAPDDDDALALFDHNPDKHEDSLRALLKRRLPQNEALAAELGQLLDARQTEPDALPGVSIGGNAEVGAVVGGNLDNLNIGQQTFEAAVQVFYGERKNSDDQDREVLASYLSNMIERFSLAQEPGKATKDRQYSPVDPISLRTLYLTMASDEWVPAEDDGTQQEVSSDENLPDSARRLAPHRSEAEPRNAASNESGAADSDEDEFELQKPYLLTKALCERQRLVILGRPGSGKTTFLHYLAVALAENGKAESGKPPSLPGWDAPLLIPFYAPLAGFAAKLRANTSQPSWKDLWRYLVQLDDIGQGLKGPLNDIFYNSGDKQKLLLLLDGLEDIVNPVLRKDVAEAIVELANQSSIFVVVTCREQAFDENVQEGFQLAATTDPKADLSANAGNGFGLVRMARLTLGQVSYFVRAWYCGVADKEKINAGEVDEQANDLIGQLKEWPNWQDLIQGPKYLDRVCQLHSTKSWVPENRAALYRDNMQRMLDRWKKPARLDQPKSLLSQLQEDRTLGRLDVEDLWRAVAALAYRARKNAPVSGQRGLIERGVVREEFLTLFQEFGIDIGLAAQKSEFVLASLEADELIAEVRPGIYQFNDYESYLAACHLIDQRGQRPDTLIMAYTCWREDASRWRDVIFIALQELLLEEDYDTVAQWIQLLVAEEHGTRTRPQKERTPAILFAAECLEKLGAKPIQQSSRLKAASKPWAGLEQVLQNVSTMSLRELWMDLTKALVDVLANESAKAPQRVDAGAYLCRLGDPRSGVCTTFPDMVAIDGAAFAPGSSPEEIIRIVDANKDWNKRQNLHFNFPDDWGSDQLNDQTVQVRPFAIARYPVTNAQYTLFVDQGGYDPQQPWWDAAGRAWLERDDAALTDASDPLFARIRRRSSKRRPEFWEHPLLGRRQSNFPVVGICWYEAQAYCRWLSQQPNSKRIYRLPSEVEWEFAARGTERRRFPWETRKRDDNRSQPEPDDSWDLPEPEEEFANFFKKFGGTTSVGSFPGGATPNGIYDMAGNVYEWTGSLYRSYPYDPNDNFDQSAGPIEHGVVMRGGGWRDLLATLFAASRNYFINQGAPPDCFFDKLGFRLASSEKS